LTIGLSQRERDLLDMLAEDANMTVGAMSKALGVSAVTLRSDLSSLAEKGLIVRTHGGAFPAFRPNILERQKHRVEAKARIAKAAAEMVENGDNLMICAGTTASLMVKYLLGKSDVKVVTNSTLILPYARINPSLHITLAGGEFRPGDEAMVGPNTLCVLEQFHVRTAFLGTDGFSIESGITANSVETATAAKKMAEQAGRTILLADSSKYGRAGFAHIMALRQISVVITDDDLAVEQRRLLEENGIKVTVV
jgi:DeoR family galactitol utilization operon repressor